MPQSFSKLNTSSTIPPIVLGSTSPFRKALMSKLAIPFSTDKPNIDETPLANETVLEMVNRLSLSKAEIIAQNHPHSIIIASDQSAVLNSHPLGKPHTFENAVQQLQSFSGQCIEFITGLVVIDTRHTPAKIIQTQDITQVYFRQLSQAQIENYLLSETPYECAGSFKSEGLGITLFEKIVSKDPNALIGLPLIELTSAFLELGISLPIKPNPLPIKG